MVSFEIERIGREAHDSYIDNMPHEFYYDNNGENDDTPVSHGAFIEAHDEKRVAEESIKKFGLE